MEPGWITLKVVDEKPGPRATCCVCGEPDGDRVVVIGEVELAVHRRCEVKLKKLESEELHQLYEQVSALQERCTRQEEELRDLRKRIAEDAAALSAVTGL